MEESEVKLRNELVNELKDKLTVVLKSYHEKLQMQEMSYVLMVLSAMLMVPAVQMDVKLAREVCGELLDTVFNEVIAPMREDVALFTLIKSMIEQNKGNNNA